jgi:lipid-A-disaccharide synthase
MSEETLRFFISAGEASGDRHGADLIRAIRRIRPRAAFHGVGGVRMRDEGCHVVRDLTTMAVMWWVDVFRNLREFIRAFEGTVHAVSSLRPHLLVPIDYPGFNLRLADRAKQSGVPVMYFVSPQVWAWWRYRVHPIAERVDRMVVVLPFEREIYREVGLRTDYVGHPIVDRFEGFEADEGIFGALRLGEDGRLVGLLPGSRRKEIRANLPLMLRAARELVRRDPRIRLAAAFPDGRLRAVGEEILGSAAGDVAVLEARAHDLMARADFCFVCAGSATLELAYFGTPMTVLYKITPPAWVLAKLLMAVRHIGLVNIVAGERIVPEFLMVRDRSMEMAEAAWELLQPTPQRERCIQALAEVRRLLGEPGAADRAARIAVEMAEAEAERRRRWG